MKTDCEHSPRVARGKSMNGHLLGKRIFEHAQKFSAARATNGVARRRERTVSVDRRFTLGDVIDRWSEDQGSQRQRTLPRRFVVFRMRLRLGLRLRLLANRPRFVLPAFAARSATTASLTPIAPAAPIVTAISAAVRFPFTATFVIADRSAGLDFSPLFERRFAR
jgi:hypothetical protein